MMIVRLNFNRLPSQLCTAFAFAFMVSTFYSRMVVNNFSVLLIAEVFLILAGVLGLICIFRDGKSLIFSYLIFTVICWLLEFVFKSGTWKYDVINFGNSLCFIGVAYNLRQNTPRPSFFSFLFYLVGLYVFSSIVIFGRSFRSVLVDGNSYNYISALVVFYFTLNVFIKDDTNSDPSIAESILFIITMIITYGRGGVICGMLYCLLYTYVNIFIKKQKIFILIIFLVLLFIFFFYGKSFLNLIVDNKSFGKFYRYGLDSNGRMIIWMNYIKACQKSVIDFIFGADPTEIFVDGNLHNSFLQMWTSLGLPFFLINILLYGYSLAKKARTHHYYYLITAVVFTVRCFTDKMMFRWYGEIIWYYIIFGFLLEDNRIPSVWKIKRTIKGESKSV